MSVDGGSFVKIRKIRKEHWFGAQGVFMGQTTCYTMIHSISKYNTDS